MRNLIIILATAVLVISFAPQSFFEEIATLKQGTEEGTASDRIYLWGFCIEMFKDHPIIGVGPLNYPYYFSSYEKGNRYPLGAQRPPHTTPLQWMAEMGIIGIIILIYFLATMYSNWRIVFRKESFKSQIITVERIDYKSINHAIGISQAGFWLGAIFLSLMPYPFYWCMPYFSEAWKNILSSNNP